MEKGEGGGESDRNGERRRMGREVAEGEKRRDVKKQDEKRRSDRLGKEKWLDKRDEIMSEKQESCRRKMR